MAERSADDQELLESLVETLDARDELIDVLKKRIELLKAKGDIQDHQLRPRTAPARKKEPEA